MSEDSEYGSKLPGAEFTENLLARRQLFRKTSTELTIVKDGASHADDTNAVGTAISPIASLHLPRRDTSLDCASAPISTVPKHHAKTAVHGHIRSPLSDSRNAYSSTSSSTGTKLFNAISKTSDLNNPAVLQERLQQLCYRTDPAGPASPKSGALADQGRNPASLGKNSGNLTQRPGVNKDAAARGSVLPDESYLSDGAPEFVSPSNLALDHRNETFPGQKEHQLSDIGAVETLKLRMESIRSSTTPVFIYMEDDSCSMFTVVPNATVNEVRMEALQKLGFMEIVESYRVFRMETGANGEPLETRIDPNTAVDYLTPPAPATIKLRMRRKSTIKWSIPVVVDERVQRTRWIVVEEVTSVEDVVRVLCMIEGKEDQAEWRLYKDGTVNKWDMNF
ncbi:hypothetical protein HDU86_001106 [Geranomyces michiganensis]|nr:hypothetical protein HDU86_001106 [Geranomyces michiganensis]